MSEKDFIKEYYGDFTNNTKNEKAFNALLAYEKNCLLYEKLYHDPRLVVIPKGERMSDYAKIYETTVKEMKSQWRDVEQYLKRN